METKREQKQSCLYQTKQTISKKTVARDKKDHYIMIKGLICQEDVTIVNIYTLNSGVPNIEYIYNRYEG